MASLRQAFGDLFAQALRPQRNLLGRARGLRLLAPCVHVLLRLREPRFALHGGNRGRHGLQREAHVGLYADHTGVVASELHRIEVDVDDLRALLRDLPVCGGLIARVAAGVDDEVRLGDDVVRATAAVAAERAAEERMVLDDDRLGVQRRDDRRLDFFRKPRQRVARAADFAPRARPRSPAARRP